MARSGARGRAQRAARRRVAPGRMARLFVARPKAFCAAVAAVPLLCLGAVVAARAISLADPGYRDYLIRNSERVQVDDAREAVKEDFALEDAAAFVSGTPAAEGPDVERSTETGAFMLSFVWRAGGAGGVEDVVNKVEGAAGGENVLTRERLAEMKRVEDVLVADQRYGEFCHYDEDARDCAGEVPACAMRESVTVHPRLYGRVVDERVCGVRDGSEVVSQEDFDAFLADISVDAQAGNGVRAIAAPYRWFLGSDANVTEVPETFVARSMFAFGRPLAGFSEADEDRAAQRALYTDWVLGRVEGWEAEARSGDTVMNMIVIGTAYGNALFGDIASRDLSFAVAAVVLVLLFMWLHTSSLFLAAAAMLQVILAFPLSYFVYRFVFQVKYFSSLQVMTIFLILGIAADDAFVFVDAWKQSGVILGPDCDLERRISWTYRRAVKAMAVTSFTTALAFGFTAVSPVMPVGTLGSWAALLVIAQYALVITMFPCAVIMWHRSLRPRSFRKCFRAPEGEPPVLISPEDDAVFADEDEAADGDEEEEEEEDTVESGEGAEEKAPWWKRAIQSSESEYRPVERFFRYSWTKLIHKVRFALIAAIVLLYGASIYFATRLEPLTETEAFLEDDHPVEVASKLMQNAFPSEDNDNFMQVVVFWGVTGIDRAGTSRYDPESIGSAVFDSTFDIKPAAAQQYLLDACATIEADKELTARFREDAADCWIRDFQTWRADNKSADAFETYASDPELVAELRAFLGAVNETNGDTPYINYAEREIIVFNTDATKVIYTELRFETDVRIEEPHRVTWPFYELWQAKVDELSEGAPEGLKNPLVTSGYPFMWAVTTQTLIRNAFIGIGLMLAAASVVLTLSTANIVVSLIAIIAIGGIVVNLLALLFLWGYEMGLTESVAVIIAAGVSFDFCSHIANAYTESSHKDRFKRTQDALTDLGISVLAGGISTIVAVAVLFLATITFFKKFARALVSTVALSLLWSLALMIAMFFLFGPENNVGSLKPLFAKCAACIPGFRKRGGSDAASEKEDA